MTENTEPLVHRRSSLFWDDDGFSTVGMVLALIITLALIFSAARIYEINTASADIQEVADAAAMAAENTVAEFYITVQVCNAIIVSLSLTMLVALGLGVAATCTPVTVSFAKTLFDASYEFKKARDTFFDSAQKTLNDLQKALPFIAALKSQEVMTANSGGPHGDSYVGVSVLVPWSADEVADQDFTQGDKAFDDAQADRGALEEKGQEAEEAAKEAARWKDLAYQHDSGSETSYCMYERALHLADMTGAQNPFYSSSQTWSFSVAYERAKTYYAARYQKESPQSSSVDELSNSALRKVFYAYAMREMDRGYVVDDGEVFDAYFPLLPKNTEEMKGTTLYTDPIYPVTMDSEGVLMMHAWSGCPAIAGSQMQGVGAIRQMDSAGYGTCSRCHFSPSSMGKIAAASTSIDNGFEFHYNIVAHCADEYKKARQSYDPAAQEVKRIVGDLFDQMALGFTEAADKTIRVAPPGRFGSVAFVVNTASSSSQGHFPSLFVSDVGDLKTRVALSSATLVKDSSEEGKTVLNSLLDGYRQDFGGFLAGGTHVILDVWSDLMSVYAEGQESFFNAVSSAVDSIPFASESGLGVWAASLLESSAGGLGLKAPDLSSPKAVLVNSAHVVEADDSSFSAKLLSVKKQALAMGSEPSLFASVLGQVEAESNAFIDGLGDEIEVVTLEFFDGYISIPITISLPGFVREGMANMVASGLSQVRNVFATVVGVRQWE